MKNLRKLCIFFSMALIPILSACSGGGSSGSGGSTASAATQGISFSIARSALVAAKATGKSVAAETLDPAARYAAVIVKDSSGATVLDMYKTEIYSLNGSYITATIPLAPASYQLAGFFILDANNKVLYSVPTQSATAEIKAMVTTVLPVSFGVTKDVTSTISLQVLAIGEATASDFGYPSIIFDVIVPSGVKFMTDVQTLDVPGRNWLQIDASLKVNNVDYSVNAVTTTLRVAQADSYTLVYSKPGYITKSITLTAAEMANYMSYPLVVVLTPGPNDQHTVSFNSNGGSAVASQNIITDGVATIPTSPSKNGYTFAGWYTNLSLTTLFNFSTPITADMTLYAKWMLPITSKVAKTGQTSCWDTAGTLITCNGTGQDGELQVGTVLPSLRFTNNSLANASDLTQTDNLTGLIWTKNANLAGAVTWQAALDYVKALNNSNYLGHNDWRLPNIFELESLVNLQYAKPADWLSAQGFIGVQANSYWSSTTYPYLPSNTNMANYVSMLDGNIYAQLKGPNISYVWPVRGGQSGGALTLPKTGQTSCWDPDGVTMPCNGTGQDGELQFGAVWPTNRFTDNSGTTDTTVTDNLTKLMWIKNGSLTGQVTWQQALEYIKNLNRTNYLGYSDWRLPNRNELASLGHMQHSSTNVSFLNSNGFANVLDAYYWSSDTDVNTTSNAWYMNMTDGIVLGSADKSANGWLGGGAYILIVRAPQTP